MSLEVLDDKYIFFTSDIDSLNNFDEKDISVFLKEIFMIISDIYNIDLFGYFKVDIYIDKKIGSFLEIKKLDDYISYSKKIDTKITIYHNSFYFKTNDLSLFSKYRDKNIRFLDGNYYISTMDVDNIFELLDFCEIEYKDIKLKPLFI